MEIMRDLRGVRKREFYGRPDWNGSRGWAAGAPVRDERSMMRPDASRRILFRLQCPWVCSVPMIRPVASRNVERWILPENCELEEPVMRPEASRKVVRRLCVLLRSLVDVPVMRPLASRKVVCCELPNGRVVAVPVMRPEASRMMVRPEGWRSIV